MHILTKEEIFDGSNMCEPVEVPDWGGCVYVKQVGIADRLRIHRIGSDNPGSDDVWIRLTVMAVCDADGNRVFDESDIDRVRELAGVTFQPVVEKVMRMNGFMTDEDVAEKKDD